MSCSSCGSPATKNSCGCSSNSCNEPPTARGPGRDPYCPSWARTLIGSVAGKLLTVKDGCINYLRHCKSGVVFYDSNTEEITVGDAPFISKEPRASRFGMLAKVVTTTTLQAGDGECSGVKEVKGQELAAQLMEGRSDGRLVVANAPQTSEVDRCDDAESQVRFDYLDPPVYKGCGLFSLLIGVPSTKRGGRSEVNTIDWNFLDRLRFRSSMLSPVKAAEASGGKRIMAFPTGGGSETDPCYLMRMVEGGPSDMLPGDATKCDSTVFDGEKWKPVKHGHWPNITGTPMTDTGDGATWSKSTTMSGTDTIALTGKPESPCGGKVFAILELAANADSGSSASYSSMALEVNGTRYLSNLSGGSRSHRTILLDVSTLESITAKIHRLSGNGAISGAVNIMGYAS